MSSLQNLPAYIWKGLATLLARSKRPLSSPRLAWAIMALYVALNLITPDYNPLMLSIWDNVLPSLGKEATSTLESIVEGLPGSSLRNPSSDAGQ